MKTPHKHAELIKAWADGAEIEKQNRDGTWIKHQDEWPWFNDWTYRIKQEPKPDVVLYGVVERHLFRETGAARASLCNTGEVCNRVDNIKLTFDGETGKLKSAEVL